MRFLLVTILLLTSSVAHAQTIQQLPQFISTSSPASAITQQIMNKSLRLTGLSDCTVGASSNGTLGCVSVGSSSVSTSSPETSSYIPFWTTTGASPALLSGGVAGLTFDGTRLKATYASTTVTSASSLCLTGDLPCRSAWPTGTVSGSGSSGRVTFWDSASSISSDDWFNWDSVNNYLTLGDLGLGGGDNPLTLIGSYPSKYMQVITNYASNGSSNTYYGDDTESHSLIVGVGNSLDANVPNLRGLAYIGTAEDKPIVFAPFLVEEARISSSGFSITDSLLVGASTTLQNFTGINSTTTNATSTTLFATTARFTNATTTTFFSTVASSTNLFSTNGNIGTLTAGTLLLNGSTTLQNVTARNSTTTSATTTSLYVSGASNFLGIANFSTTTDMGGRVNIDNTASDSRVAGLFVKDSTNNNSAVFAQTGSGNLNASLANSDSGVAGLFQHTTSGASAGFATTGGFSGLFYVGNVGIGTTSPGTLLGLGNTGSDTINISPTGTSTFGRSINLRTGCFSVAGVCVSNPTGGTAHMLTAWTSASGLTATGTPSATAYLATSTTATSIFNGAFDAGGTGVNKFRVGLTGITRVGKDLGDAPFNVRVAGTGNATTTVMKLSADANHTTADLGATVIDFNDNKADGGNDATYGRFGVKITDNNTNIERGTLTWSVANAPTLVERMALNSYGSLMLGFTTPAALSTGISVNGYGYYTGGIGAGVYNSTPGSIETTAGLTVGGNTNLTGTLSANSSASSTFSQGINLLAGCFALNSTCIGTGGGGNVVNYMAHQFDFSEDGAISNALTRYLSYAGGTIATTNILKVTVSATGTLSHLFVTADTNTLNNITTVTVMKNDVDTGLTCTVAATGLSCNNQASTVSVIGGDYLALKIVTTGTGTLTRPRASFQLKVSGSFGTQWTTSGNNIYFGSTTPERVGIGTSTPGTTLTVNGTITSTSTPPTLSSCGTSPTVVGNNNWGEITTGATATGCTATFATSFPTFASCTITNQSMSLVNAMTYTVSKTAFTVTQTGLGGSKINYRCDGY